MHKTIYCDTNVFDHMYKGIGISKSVINFLSSLVNNGKVILLPSIYNIQEILSLFESEPDNAENELRLVCSLADRDKIIKPVNEYLMQVIRNYATGYEEVNPYISDKNIHSKLCAFLMNPTKDNLPYYSELIHEIKTEKSEFVSSIQTIKKGNIKFVKEILTKRNGKKPSFEYYFEFLSEKFARQRLLKPTKMEEPCVARGLEDFLNIKAIRMFVGSRLSYTYAQDFERREPKLSDSVDLHHAILATIADVFITHDKNLKWLLSRIHIDGFEIMDLHTFLKRFT